MGGDRLKSRGQMGYGCGYKKKDPFASSCEKYGERPLSWKENSWKTHKPADEAEQRETNHSLISLLTLFRG